MAATIRPLVIADLPSVAALEQMLFSHPHNPEQLQAMCEASDACWVAEAEGSLIGYVIASFGGGQADLLVIAVDGRYQQQGIASRLLANLVDQLQGLSVEALFLEVRASNQAAINFYRHQGFEEIGIRRHYYPVSDNRREDALLFKKGL